MAVWLGIVFKIHMVEFEIQIQSLIVSTDLLQRRVFKNINSYIGIMHLVFERGFLTLPLNNRELANQMFFHK